MIFANVNVTVKETESVCDYPILLYRGDKNVQIRFILHGNKFIVQQNTYAQLIINRPTAPSLFTDPYLIEGNTVTMTITEDMIDELTEIGTYQFQIRLFDDNLNAQVTLPPCYSGLIIERPIAVEGESLINRARINDAIVFASNEYEDIFDEDNLYIRTNWRDGDLISDSKMNKIEEAIYELSGRETGGGGATAPYISTTLPENNILGLGEIFKLNVDFSSPAMGRGKLKVFINDNESMNVTIQQGENSIDILDTLFSKGNNRVTIYVIDRTGVMSNSLTFYVRYGGLEIVSDFDAYTAYDHGSIVRYYFTPTSVDTSLSLTMYMSIDGEVKPGVACTSDTRGYYTFPNNLEVGAHYCQAYIKDSTGNTSNILAFNLIILDDTSLVVASDTVNPSLEEGSQLTLDYKVYMKNNNSFITKTYVDNALVSTGTCGLETTYYKSSSLSEGIHTIKIEVYDITETVSDYIIWTVTITPSTYTMLEPITAGALFIGTTQNMTNASENKEVWVGKDQDGTNINATLNNFAFNSESGWVDDELLITGASSVEVPIAPLTNNARYGFTLDLEFASKMIGVEDALVLNLWDDTKDCGIKITTEKVILRSAEGNQCDLYFTDDEMTSVIFVIDRNEATAKIYLNGVMCSAFHLSDYSVDGVPYLEDFTVNSNIMLGGSGHARIRNLRVYQIALTTNEILNNFMANERDKGKQRELVEFQKGDHLPTLTIYCDFSGLGKDDKKPCSITYVSTDEEKYGKSFTLTHKKSTCQYQGTSSMAYPIKNYRINLADENGDKLKYEFPFGQPEHRYTLKADFMSSGHWTNTGLTKWINNNLYNYNEDDEKSMNPKKWYDINNGGKLNDTRECIYGFPCRLILVNDGDTPLNEGQNEPTPGNTKDMGIFNFNHDKDATDTMGFDDDVFPNCASYEVTANSDTSAGAFISYINSKNIFKHENAFDSSATVDVNLPCGIPEEGGADELKYIKQSFELRFPDEDDVAEDWGFMGIPGEEGTGLKALIDWVDGCTDEEFVRDFEQHFHKDYTLRYFLLVITLGMVDNLGKNMMLDTWDNKIFMPRFYDCDTICSYDNSGQLKFDVDIEMDQGYWNTSSSRLWTRIRDLMYDDLVAKYNNMRQNGLSYESLMQCFYDEQIAKIPQKYYNMDYDVKYAPFADSYLGMANGDTYEHLKRWLKQRLIFVDTLYDYAPSYNNDVLTIRANTTELMRLEIETYTPVYQHLSWYNNQMDKKKIDGKIAVEFTGKAMAATDQEVLIYGGSNIKSIKGITSMNPNRMLIGSATRLIELDAPNCPLLSDINANKSNLAPHVYLNKVNLSGCPLLGGNLIINNSPLVREIDIRGTGIVGLNLPSNLRNLEVLKLPSAIKTLNLNDAGQLHTLEFESGSEMETVSMTNCNALTNVVNFDLENVANVALNNSYNTANELYFSKAANLSLRNMPNLERVIYTPNAEYEVFDKTNVDNASDYKVSVFNSPKCNTFMVTAPYRESYNNCGIKDEIVHVLDYDNMVNIMSSEEPAYGMLNPSTGVFTNNDSGIHHSTPNFIEVQPNVTITVNGTASIFNICFYDESQQYIEGYGINNFTSREFKTPKNCRYLKFQTHGNAAAYRSVEIFSPSIKEEHKHRKDHGEVKPNEVFIANSIDISSTQFTDVKLLATTDTNVLKLPQTAKNLIVDSAYDLDTDYLEDGEYDVVHGELVEQYTEDWNEEVGVLRQLTKVITKDDLVREEPGAPTLWYAPDIEVAPGFMFYFQSSFDNSYTSLQGIASDGVTVLETFITYSTLVDRGEVLRWWPKSDVRYIRLRTMKDYEGEYTITYSAHKVPNIIPSASDGSIIQSMYAPSNTVQPASGVWDLKGLEFDNFYTYGMNNDVKPSDDSYINVVNPSDIIAYTGKATNNNQPIGQLFWDAGQANNIAFTCIRLSAGGHTITTSEGTNIAIFAYSNIGDTTKTTHFGAVGFTLDSPKYISFQIPNTTEYIEIDGCRIYLSEITIIDGQLAKDTSGWYNYLECGGKEIIFDEVRVDKILGTPTSITMPARYDDYNITIKNADISPKTNNTMLYPLLVNEDNPITGTLDYSEYEGTSLDWAAAYMNKDEVVLTIPDEVLLNSTSQYNIDKDSEYKIIDPRTICIMTYDAPNHEPSMYRNSGIFTDYTKTETANDDGTYTVTIRANNIGIIPTEFSSRNGHLLSVEYLNTKELISMVRMFQNCAKLTALDVSYWDTSKVANMESLFNGCTGLTQLDLSSWDTSNVTNMESLFNGCTSLTQLDLSNFDTKNITNMADMFNNCKALTSLDVSNFDTSNVTGMNGMFVKCQKLLSLDLSNFNTSKVTNMNGMFQNCNALTSLDLSSFDTSNVESMSGIFQYCTNLTSLDLSSFDTSNVKDMNHMFDSCSGLTTLDLSGWDTSNVTNMHDMFCNCNNLTSLDVSGFDTSNVTIMGGMFVGCSLTSLDVSGFDTSNVTNMVGMFQNCNKLTSLDVSGFDTSNVTNMSNMFNGCYKLTELDSMQNISVALSLSSTNLDITSLLDVIDNLLTVTTNPTLTLGSTLLVKLTEDQIAVATNKGWTVA